MGRADIVEGLATRNTFLSAPEPPPAAARARALRRNRTDGDTPQPGDLSLPPGHLRRLDDEGNAVPGSQDSQGTVEPCSYVDISVPNSQKSAISSQMGRLVLDGNLQTHPAPIPRTSRRRAQASSLLTCAQCQSGAGAFQARDDRGLMLHIGRAHLGQQLSAAAIAQLRSLDRVACQVCSGIRKRTNPRCDRCECATPTRALVLGDSVPDTRRSQQRTEREVATPDSQEHNVGAGNAAQARHGLDSNDSEETITTRRVALSDQSVAALGSLKRASDLPVPECIAVRFAQAWTESLEGAMQGAWTNWFSAWLGSSCLRIRALDVDVFTKVMGCQKTKQKAKELAYRQQ